MCSPWIVMKLQIAFLRRSELRSPCPRAFGKRALGGVTPVAVTAIFDLLINWDAK